jgi:hypothetical protein
LLRQGTHRRRFRCAPRNPGRGLPGRSPLKLPLDTHALLWWLTDDPALKASARAVIRPPHTLVFVSAATSWEIDIEQALGRLEAPDDLAEALAANRFHALPITAAHALAAGRRPHRTILPEGERTSSERLYREMVREHAGRPLMPERLRTTR